MYEVWKIEAGSNALVDQQRDPQVAQQHAIAQSRVVDAVFAVVRQGFGTPLYFVWRGVVGDPLEIMRRMSVTVTPPLLTLDPPPVQTVSGDVIVDVGADEDGETDEQPKPRRRRKGPEETKENDD